MVIEETEVLADPYTEAIHAIRAAEGTEDKVSLIRSLPAAGRIAWIRSLPGKYIYQSLVGLLVGRDARTIDRWVASDYLTVDEMVNMDLSYAPPFSPVWDPVLIATRKLSEQVDRTLGEFL